MLVPKRIKFPVIARVPSEKSQIIIWNQIFIFFFSIKRKGKSRSNAPQYIQKKREFAYVMLSWSAGRWNFWRRKFKSTKISTSNIPCPNCVRFSKENVFLDSKNWLRSHFQNQIRKIQLRSKFIRFTFYNVEVKVFRRFWISVCVCSSVACLQIMKSSWLVDPFDIFALSPVVVG